jgi:hypothetical protein
LIRPGKRWQAPTKPYTLALWIFLDQ